MTRIKAAQISVKSVSHYFFRTQIKRILRIRRKNLRSSAFICALFCLLLATTVSAHNSPTATAAANRNTLTVGDPIKITVRVAHPPAYEARLAVTDWADFELLTQPETQAAATGSTIQLQVTLWAPGSHELPPLPISLTSQAGQRETAVTNPLTFTVNSVLAAEDHELRDIRPQASLTQPRLWWPWLLLASGLAAGAAALWHSRRARQPAVVQPTAQAEALAALDALTEPEPGKWAAFATAVLHILRRFLQQTTHIPTGYRTTSELAAALPQTRLTADQQAEIVAVFQQIDALRFGPPPEKISAETLVEPARRIILPTAKRTSGT